MILIWYVTGIYSRLIF